jgi:hypothetical protein
MLFGDSLDRDESGAALIEICHYNVRRETLTRSGPPSVPQARHDAGFVAAPKRKRPPRGPAAVVHFKSQKFATRSVVQVLVAELRAADFAESLAEISIPTQFCGKVGRERERGVQVSPGALFFLLNHKR